MSQTKNTLQLPIVDHTPTPYDGPSREEVLALRHQYLSPGIITYYREPLMVVEGRMQYLWDETGRRKGYYARPSGAVDAVTMSKRLG